MGYSIMPVISFPLGSVPCNILVSKELQRLSCLLISGIDILPVISNTRTALHKRLISKPTGGHNK